MLIVMISDNVNLSVCVCLFLPRGKLGEFLGNSVQPRGKIVTNNVVLVHHSNICVKRLLTG